MTRLLPSQCYTASNTSNSEICSLSREQGHVINVEQRKNGATGNTIRSTEKHSDLSFVVIGGEQMLVLVPGIRNLGRSVT